ncbi:MAG TPA: cob(I)yrinic acid a,c-diamide adenosyltransferase [Bryobacteraceae bacterium]|nr:cob(I)yrinic acid a,c-diamide adenosyltransferase [Bryobacteraceae bacterium]
MSIATKRGDGGQTGLAGGIRVSKTHPRVECYGTIDELISQMGFARSICGDAEVAERVKAIQRELYKVGSAIATPPESKKTPPEITPAMVDALEAEVHRIEAEPGVPADWSLPGGTPDAAALDVARTVCRRAERLATSLMEAGVIQNPSILAYLNRLSDVLWLYGRLVEARLGVDSSLRTEDKPGPRWSRAW